MWKAATIALLLATASAYVQETVKLLKIKPIQGPILVPEITQKMLGDLLNPVAGEAEADGQQVRLRRLERIPVSLTRILRG
jgi:hypothetical protein